MRNISTYEGLILELKPNEIFVFGSNTQGRHGKGAAKKAMKWGAIYGVPAGRQGQTYAIITKDLTQHTHPSISKVYIIDQIIALYDYARVRPELRFMIAYNGIGTNLNGYTPEQMAEMFAFVKPIPENIVFEKNFAQMIKTQSK